MWFNSLRKRCRKTQSSILGGKKMGVRMIPPFYLQNGIIEDRNHGSSPATILNTGNLSFDRQARQLFETIPTLKLQLGQTNAADLVQSSLFYISLGIHDYIQLFLHGAFGLREQCYSFNSVCSILVKHTIQVVQNQDNAKASKISCMGIGPLECVPCSPWEAYNASSRKSADVRYRNEEINQRILPYNVMLSEQHLTLT